MGEPLKMTFFALIVFNLTGMAMIKEMPKEKTGILLVSFGTSYSDAQGALDHVEDQVRKAFPDIEIRWAFTSDMIRNKLKKQNRYIDSPAEAMAKMGSEGFTRIAVQSLHIIPGEEYESLQKTVNAFNHISKNGQTIRLGKPLLYRNEDIAAVCDVLEKIVPDERAGGEAVVFMGHGTPHPSNIYYPGVQYYLWEKSALYFLATVEGYPGLNEIFPKLKEQQIKTVWLIPFMSVAGDHAQNDMAGDEPESWKSQLEAAGYIVKPVLKGLAGYDEIAGIWVNHLKEVLYEPEN
ncbi:MAG: sirohydrochlorin cobaltochelatase [Mangrovibacterium sp.]